MEYWGGGGGGVIKKGEITLQTCNLVHIVIACYSVKNYHSRWTLYLR